VTTLEPGARDDFTAGPTVSPRSTAFFARRPAASMTEGFEVLVQLVIAAMRTLPWPTLAEPWPFIDTSALAAPRSSGFLPNPFSATGRENEPTNSCFILGSSILSWGRFGPATLGTTVPMSSSMSWE